MTPRAISCWLYSRPISNSPLLMSPIISAPTIEPITRAGAAEQAGAAEDRRRDDRKLVALAELETPRMQAARIEHARDAGGHAGDDQHAHLDRGGVDAAVARRGLAAARRQHAAAEGRLAQDDVPDDADDDHPDQQHRDMERCPRRRRSRCSCRRGSERTWSASSTSRRPARCPSSRASSGTRGCRCASSASPLTRPTTTPVGEAGEDARRAGPTRPSPSPSSSEARPATMPIERSISPADST